MELGQLARSQDAYRHKYIFQSNDILARGQHQIQGIGGYACSGLEKISPQENTKITRSLIQSILLYFSLPCSAMYHVYVCSERTFAASPFIWDEGADFRLFSLSYSNGSTLQQYILCKNFLYKNFSKKSNKFIYNFIVIKIQLIMP